MHNRILEYRFGEEGFETQPSFLHFAENKMALFSVFYFVGDIYLKSIQIMIACFSSKEFNNVTKL